MTERNGVVTSTGRVGHLPAIPTFARVVCHRWCLRAFNLLDRETLGELECGVLIVTRASLTCEFGLDYLPMCRVGDAVVKCLLQQWAPAPWPGPPAEGRGAVLRPHPLQPAAPAVVVAVTLARVGREIAGGLAPLCDRDFDREYEQLLAPDLWKAALKRTLDLPPAEFDAEAALLALAEAGA